MEGNFRAHNEEVQRIWRTFYSGRPERMPMILGVNPRYLLLDPRYNPKGITFEQYFTDPEIMFHVQLEFQDFVRHHMWADHEMGVPEEGWSITVDFQNVYESAWLGAPVVFRDGNCPACAAFLDDDRKHLLFEKGVPDPFSGLMAKAREYTERFNAIREKGFVYKGAPLAPVVPSVLYTDGPFTLACNLRGADRFCLDIYEDPDFARQLLDFVTQATIQRLKAWRRYLGQAEIQPSLAFADDSIAMLSPAMYREWVMPCHKQLIDALAHPDGDHAVHLCGNASHLFGEMAARLHVVSFDTGYPIDHRKVAQELGPAVQIQGGPTAGLLLSGSREEVAEETVRIIRAVKDVTRRFVLRDANNVSPGTPLENIRVMYDKVREAGVYETAEDESMTGSHR